MPKQNENWFAKLACGYERSFNSKTHRLQFLKLHKKCCSLCNDAEVDTQKNIINGKFIDIQNITNEQRNKIIDIIQS
jgi:hypothetical protein